jgi:hypothetical protein
VRIRGGLPSRRRVTVMVTSLPVSVRSTSIVPATLVNAQIRCGAGSFPHVLRGRDVRNSLWETGWTLPRPVGIGANQV